MQEPLLWLGDLSLQLPSEQLKVILVPQELVAKHQGMLTTMLSHMFEMYVSQGYANLTVASDAFTRREQASEAKYIRDKELERYNHVNSLHSSTTNYDHPTETSRLTNQSLIASRG